MPRTRWRVVWGLSDTIDTLAPQMALTSDDLPTLGRPTMATPRLITGLDELRTLVGEHLGYSDYLEITQERVDAFADATGDHQWIHVDVERAKAGPFGG